MRELLLQTKVRVSTAKIISTPRLHRYSFVLLLLAVAGVFLVVPPEVHAALYNASGLLGQPNYASFFINYNGSSTPNAQGFDFTTDVNLDPLNPRLFVADNNRVLVFLLDAANNISTTTASFVLGQPDFTSNISTTTRNGLNDAQALAYDATSQRLFVASYYGNRVLVFDVSTSTLARTPRRRGCGSCPRPARLHIVHCHHYAEQHHQP